MKTAYGNLCGSDMTGCICRNCERIRNRMVHCTGEGDHSPREMLMMDTIVRLRREKQELAGENSDLLHRHGSFPYREHDVDGRLRPLPAFLLPDDADMTPVAKPWETMAELFDCMADIADFAWNGSDLRMRRYMQSKMYSLRESMFERGIGIEYHVPGKPYMGHDAEVRLVPTDDYELDGIVKSIRRFGLSFRYDAFESQKAYLEVYRYVRTDVSKDDSTTQGAPTDDLSEDASGTGA